MRKFLSHEYKSATFRIATDATDPDPDNWTAQKSSDHPAIRAGDPCRARKAAGERPRRLRLRSSNAIQLLRHRLRRGFVTGTEDQELITVRLLALTATAGRGAK